MIDRILVVARVGGKAVHVATVPDPRIRRSLPFAASARVRVVRGGGGMLWVDLPASFGDAGTVARAQFEFYAMSNSVSANAPVIVDSLATLQNGATLLAASPGAALSSILFAPKR